MVDLFTYSHMSLIVQYGFFILFSVRYKLVDIGLYLFLFRRGQFYCRSDMVKRDYLHVVWNNWALIHRNVAQLSPM